MAFLRSWPGRILLLAATVGVLYYVGLWLSNKQVLQPYYFRIIVLSGIAMILAVSLNLVNGITGQFSIGHAGFMALGAYAGAAFTVYGQHRFLPVLAKAGPVETNLVFLAAMLVSGVVAALAGLLVGLPSLRLRGDYLAIVTLGFGEIIRVAILNLEVVGGSSGFNGTFSPQFGFVPIPRLTSFLWIYLVVVLLVIFSRNLVRSTHGLAFLSVREDEVAAEAMGVGTTRLKVTAFVISAFFAGIAGCLYAHLDGYLKPESFGFLRSIEIVTMVVLGGMGSISGSLLGAIILTAAPELLRDWLSEIQRRPEFKVLKGLPFDLVRQLLYALLLVVLMLTRPQGIFGAREFSLSGLYARFRKKPAAPVVGS